MSQIFDLSALRVAGENVRLAGGEGLAEPDLQEFGDDSVVGHRHEGRARAGDPQRSGAAFQAGCADAVVIGDERATEGLL